MRYSLKYKILLAALFPTIITIVVIAAWAVGNKSDTERQLVLDRINSYLILLESGDLSLATVGDEDKLKAVLGEDVNFSGIISKDFSVPYSHGDISTLITDNQHRFEIDKAFEGIVTIKNIEIGETVFLEYISPVIVNEKIVAVFGLSLPYIESDRRINNYTKNVVILSLIGTFFCYLLSTVLLKIVVLSGIYKLKKAAANIEKGDFGFKVDIDSKDELGELAVAFNDMSVKLKESYSILEAKVKERTKELEKERKSLDSRVQERTKELEKLKNDLEATVKERTATLQEKLTELERMNKHMIGRELKMAELKNEIKKLKGKI